MIKTRLILDKVIIVGDIHFGVNSSSAEWHNHIKNFFNNFLIPLLAKIKEKYPNETIAVIFMGDWNDIKQQIKTEINNDSIIIMEDITKIFPAVDLVGNHDTPTKTNPEINTVKTFKYMDDVLLVERSTVLEACTGEKLLFMAWNSDLEYLKQVIAENPADYCFTHLSISGFYYEGVPVEESKYLAISDFASFKKVFSGHIHSYQEKENIMYVGTPYHIRSIEHKNTHLGVHMLDFKTNQLHFIENKISPRYKHISLFKLMEMTKSEADEFVRNNYVTVISPTDLYGKLNFDNINSSLSGYRNIEHITITQKIRNEKDNLDIEENLDQDELKQIELGTKFDEFIDTIDVINLENKVQVAVDDKMKIKMKADTRKMIQLSESQIGSDNFEL